MESALFHFQKAAGNAVRRLRPVKIAASSCPVNTVVLREKPSIIEIYNDYIIILKEHKKARKTL